MAALKEAVGHPRAAGTNEHEETSCEKLDARGPMHVRKRLHVLLACILLAFVTPVACISVRKGAQTKLTHALLTCFEVHACHTRG